MFEKLKYFSTIFFGTFIIAVGVYFFMNPNHIISGSITGLAVVLVNFIPLSLSVMTLILNIICIILAFLFIDKAFGTKIIFISILLPVLLFVFETAFPDPGSPTGNIALDVVGMIVVICFGQAILFNANAASGGLDIIAKIMNKYLHLDLGHHRRHGDGRELLFRLRSSDRDHRCSGDLLQRSRAGLLYR